MQRKLLMNSGEKISVEKSYEVRITEEALSDMEKIHCYISEELHSPGNADRQYDRIAEQILSLKNLPKRNRILDFEPCRRNGMRRLIIDHFSIFYVVRGKTVIVTDVLYSASDLSSRLYEKHQKEPEE